MSFSIRFSPEEEKLFRSYTNFHGCSLSEDLKFALLEKIEDKYDIVLAELLKKNLKKTLKLFH